MNTEIVKIIEAGLSHDTSKVVSFAKLLAENLEKTGQKGLATRIRHALESVNVGNLTSLENLTPPVDQESRMAIADVVMPSKDSVYVELPPSVQQKITHFFHSISHRAKLTEHGIDAQATLLLYGPPGCGKTTLANLIAQKTGLPLITARFDALISPLLGNTSKNIRKIFDYANGKACVLFLDEFDAIAKARDDQFELGELKRVINSLLQNIDQFTKSGNILVAATNHPELLDRAIWRRFNTVIELSKPSIDIVTKLLNNYLSKYPNDILANSKEREKIEALLSEFSPADIKTICQNAIASAIIEGESKLSSTHLLYEYYQFRERGASDIGALMSFLNVNGVPQRAIAKFTGMSMRQIQKHFKEEITNDAQ